MIGFVSYADLSKLIREGMRQIPDDIDLVIGIPRSGMIPAYMVGLYRNLAVVDLPGFLSGIQPAYGSRPVKCTHLTCAEAKSILLVDDSLCSGKAMNAAVGQILAAGYKGRLTTCVAIIEPAQAAKADISFCWLPCPRFFEWNAFHLPSLIGDACFDIDGVLCEDPSEVENDDGEKYGQFLAHVLPRFKPTSKIAHIVSSRLHKYRTQTEKQLARHGIEYGELHLLDLPSAKERRRLGIHAEYKANVFKQTATRIFFESDPIQSERIAILAGKPVLCTQTMRLYNPPLFKWPLKEIVRRYRPAYFVRAKRVWHRIRSIAVAQRA